MLHIIFTYLHLCIFASLHICIFAPYLKMQWHTRNLYSQQVSWDKVKLDSPDCDCYCLPRHKHTSPPPQSCRVPQTGVIVIVIVIFIVIVIVIVYLLFTTFWVEPFKTSHLAFELVHFHFFGWDFAILNTKNFLGRNQ